MASPVVDASVYLHVFILVATLLSYFYWGMWATMVASRSRSLAISWIFLLALSAFPVLTSLVPISTFQNQYILVFSGEVVSHPIFFSDQLFYCSNVIIIISGKVAIY